MGSWGIGPFDSDHASEFASEVDLARAGERHIVIEHRLTRYTGASDPDDYLMDEAIAAAALVAAQCPGGLPVTSGYGPQDLIPELPARLRRVASAALDLVLLDAQRHVDGWTCAGARDRGEQWLEGIEGLRTVLDSTTPYTVAYVPKPLLAHELGTRTVHEALGVNRIRTLPGAGESGPRGLLVRQLNQAALRLDDAHKELLQTVDTALTRLDAVRRQLQTLADGEIRELHSGDVPAFMLHTVLSRPLAARAERHQHLTGLIDLYRELSPAPTVSERVASARGRTTAAPAALPTTAPPLQPTTTPPAARNR
ncbi:MULTISPECIES: DUF4259 domain-containing protein [unclassified Kitasatospora]|uniref:DUF4259 domain-containing protein n=1 Tax=unclassified Kitasatospora TaxID=2633591 RepID=UPI000708B056|nr:MULTISPECIES: DUF4259 domain-containing protein [unclassified Kitasatospora]KQV20918.1 hypothetical protein ASC99_20660 [Kitasatospora sp. Root107]KRB60428.1 hypothetical protein ASE03_12520 [Kitasatospora sp. Root187]